MTAPIGDPTSGRAIGRVVLWTALVATLVIGSAFLVVGLGSEGDARLGGFMVAVPCAIVAAICAAALRRR